MFSVWESLFFQVKVFPVAGGHRSVISRICTQSCLWALAQPGVLADWCQRCYSSFPVLCLWWVLSLPRGSAPVWRSRGAPSKLHMFCSFHCSFSNKTSVLWYDNLLGVNGLSSQPCKSPLIITLNGLCQPNFTDKRFSPWPWALTWITLIYKANKNKITKNY